MMQRIARTGARAGGSFWGCSRFPTCRATVDIDDAADAGDPVQDTAFRRRTTWTSYGSRGEWSAFYTSAGGRLRAWDSNLSTAQSRGLSQSVFFLSGFARDGQVSESASVS